MLIANAPMVRDFRLCRYLYNARHNLQLPERSKPERDQLPAKFEDAMKKLVKRSHFHTMSGSTFPTIDKVLYEWDRIWHAGRSVQDIINARNTPGKSIDSFNTDAIKMIRGFHARSSRNPAFVAGFLGEDYTVQLADDVIITGTIDLVLQRGNQVFLPHYTTRNPSSFREGTEGMAKLVLDAMAYRAKTGKMENYSTIEFLKTGKTQVVVVDDVTTTSVKELLAEMASCERWPAASGTYWCDQCQFKQDCRTW